MTWNGIVACWPEARKVHNPWTDDSNLVEVEGAGLAEEVKDLVRATLEAAQGDFQSDRKIPKTADPNVQAGWAALTGWMHLENREFSKALDAFSVIEPKDEDPFSLKAARSIADHLIQSHHPTLGLSESQAPEAVWKEVFSPFSDCGV